MLKLIQIIESARANFVSADWRHEYKGEAAALYCEGDIEGCLYCFEVKQSAAVADQEAEQAIEALIRGDIVAACSHLESARSIELEWGDAPAYGPAHAALEAAAAV